MKKVLAGIVILLLVVALGFSIFFAVTSTKSSNVSDDNKTEKHDKKDKKEKSTEGTQEENDVIPITVKMRSQSLHIITQ